MPILVKFDDRARLDDGICPVDPDIAGIGVSIPTHNFKSSLLNSTGRCIVRLCCSAHDRLVDHSRGPG